MNNSSFNEDVVQCHYNGAIVPIPAKLFFSMTLGIPVQKQKYIRIKEGTKMYSMGRTEFQALVHDAGAVYKRNRMALVNLEVLDNFMEYFKEQ